MHLEETNSKPRSRKCQKTRSSAHPAMDLNSRAPYIAQQTCCRKIVGKMTGRHGSLSQSELTLILNPSLGPLGSSNSCEPGARQDVPEEKLYAKKETPEQAPSEPRKHDHQDLRGQITPSFLGASWPCLVVVHLLRPIFHTQILSVNLTPAT